MRQERSTVVVGTKTSSSIEEADPVREAARREPRPVLSGADAVSPLRHHLCTSVPDEERGCLPRFYVGICRGRTSRPTWTASSIRHWRGRRPVRGRPRLRRDAAGAGQERLRGVPVAPGSTRCWMPVRTGPSQDGCPSTYSASRSSRVRSMAGEIGPAPRPRRSVAGRPRPRRPDRSLRGPWRSTASGRARATRCPVRAVPPCPGCGGGVRHRR